MALSSAVLKASLVRPLLVDGLSLTGVTVMFNFAVAVNVPSLIVYVTSGTLPL
jgi:hypothetical protein